MIRNTYRNLSGFAAFVGIVTKPHTDARVCVNWRGIEFYDIGFASMNYKDSWDAKYGERMAIHKAIAGIAKQIAYEQRPSARFEVLVPPLIMIEEEEHVPTNQS